MRIAHISPTHCIVVDEDADISKFEDIGIKTFASVSFPDSFQDMSIEACLGGLVINGVLHIYNGQKTHTIWPFSPCLVRDEITIVHHGCFTSRSQDILEVPVTDSPSSYGSLRWGEVDSDGNVSFVFSLVSGNLGRCKDVDTMRIGATPLSCTARNGKALVVYDDNKFIYSDTINKKHSWEKFFAGGMVGEAKKRRFSPRCPDLDLTLCERMGSTDYLFFFIIGTEMYCFNWYQWRFDYHTSMKGVLSYNYAPKIVKL